MKDITVMRGIAKKAAKLDKCVYILFEREDKTIGFCRENENYNGKLIEYIYG